MFAVEVRDHIMIAHSFEGAVFGPAQRLHGATFVVDAAFFAEELDADGLVVDIGLATKALTETLAPLRYVNLDEVPVFAGRNTTTEFLCRHIFDALAAAVREGRLGHANTLLRLRVQLHESHVARAWYEGPLLKEPIVFAIPGELATPTGGYAYDRRMMAELRRAGRDVRHLSLPAGFPTPSAVELSEAGALFADLPDRTIVLADGLAFGAIPEIAERQAARLDLVALVHHPLADENGIDAAARDGFLASERRALAAARAVVVTSTATARALVERFGVLASAITVAEPGCEASGAAVLDGLPPVVLSVGTLVFRKGHDVLVDALSTLRERHWRCRIVGAADRSPETAADLRHRIDQLRLTDRITLAGAVPDIGAEMRAADVFVLATRHEGYGMVFAEAMAHGLPVVGTQVGAVPGIVPGSAGILVPPDDPVALASALALLLQDPAERRRLGAGARAAAAGFATWAQSAGVLAAALDGLRS